MKRFTSVALLAALVFGAAACGDDSASSSSVPSTEPRANAVISLSPSATEMLFSMGAGDQVIAVDDQSNFPAEALAKPHDLSGFEPNVEAIAALHPDLVIMQDDKVKDQLEALGITVFVGSAPATFDDVYTQIEQLGAAVGRAGEASDLVAQMKSDIAAAVAAVPAPATALKVYHELDNTFYSVTSNTFIGQVYQLFGITNIADGAQPGNDYPQLNAEYIVQANPELIVLADTKCCGETAATVAARPGWDAIAAVQHGGVVELDDDIASRWGPRLVDFVKAVSAAAAAVPAGA